MSAEIKTFEVKPAEGVPAGSLRAQMRFWNVPEGKLDPEKDIVRFEGTEDDAAKLRAKTRSVACVTEVPVANETSKMMPLQRAALGGTDY